MASIPVGVNTSSCTLSPAARINAYIGTQVGLLIMGLGTSEVSVHQGRLGDGSSIYLVDTPGFDDTQRKDTDVLREIADFLNESYESQIHLSGIVYLHRISDTRLGGSGMRNLRMFKKLVGEDGLANVVFATTMWSMLPDLGAGYAREAELTQRNDFWQYMISKGKQSLPPRSWSRVGHGDRAAHH